MNARLLLRFGSVGILAGCLVAACGGSNSTFVGLGHDASGSGEEAGFDATSDGSADAPAPAEDALDSTMSGDAPLDVTSQTDDALDSTSASDAPNDASSPTTCGTSRSSP